jgi:hypothetical protein
VDIPFGGFAKKLSDTTRFSGVVLQLPPNPTQGFFKTPPTLVAWSFNFGLTESLQLGES